MNNANHAPATPGKTQPPTANGQGARPVVVMLHSSAASSRQWDGLAGHLRLACEVHAIDLHGHGKQAAWGGDRPLGLHDEAALALPILRAAGGGHVIGHSYGAAVALHLAATHPDLVRSLAVYEPVLFAWLDEHEPGGPAARVVRAVAAEMRVALDAGDPAAAAAHFVDYWAGGPAWAHLDPRRQQSITALMPSITQQFDAVYATPLPRAALARLVMPVLCLSGERSTMAASCVAGLLRARLPQAQHETLAGLGHMAPLTQAERVNARLLRFIDAQMPQALAPAAP